MNKPSLINSSHGLYHNPVCQAFCQNGYCMMSHAGCIHPVTCCGIATPLHMAKDCNPGNHTQVFPDHLSYPVGCPASIRKDRQILLRFFCRVGSLCDYDHEVSDV